MADGYGPSTMGVKFNPRCRFRVRRRRERNPRTPDGAGLGAARTRRDPAADRAGPARPVPGICGPGMARGAALAPHVRFAYVTARRALETRGP